MGEPSNSLDLGEPRPPLLGQPLIPVRELRSHVVIRATAATPRPFEDGRPNGNGDGHGIPPHPPTSHHDRTPGQATGKRIQATAPARTPLFPAGFPAGPICSRSTAPARSFGRPPMRARRARTRPNGSPPAPSPSTPALPGREVSRNRAWDARPDRGRGSPVSPSVMPGTGPRRPCPVSPAPRSGSSSPPSSPSGRGSPRDRTSGSSTRSSGSSGARPSLLCRAGPTWVNRVAGSSRRGRRGSLAP